MTNIHTYLNIKENRGKKKRKKEEARSRNKLRQNFIYITLRLIQPL